MTTFGRSTFASCFIGLVLAMGVCRAFAEPSPKSMGLCRAEEVSYFGCETTKSRWISLCGRRDGLIQYRFGTKTKVELQYPSGLEAGKTLRFAHYMRYRIDRFDVLFDAGGFEYSVFDYVDSSEGRTVRSAGVAITKPDGTSALLKCIRRPQSRIAELESRLPCDPEYSSLCQRAVAP